MSNEYRNKVYNDRYKVLEELPSQNDYEFYFKGKDLQTDKTLQIRIIPIYKDNPEQIEQSQKFIFKELSMLKQLRHKGLPVFVEHISNSNENIIITEYREGRSLDTVLAPGRQFSEDDTLKFLAKLLPIISYLHSQEPPVIYRDLQPKNIYVDANGDLFLTKYEAARTYKADKVKDTVVVSTRGYNPPEQALGKGQSDPRSDIYSIGMITFQMLTGKDPTSSLILPKISDIRKDLDAVWTSLVAKATNIKQDKRYNTCEELITDLSRIKNGALDYNPAQGKISGTPEQKPSAPAQPSAPQMPVRQPAAPAQPVRVPQPGVPRPGMPAQPSAPAQAIPPRPGVPVQPVAPAQPSAPQPPLQPSAPVQPAAPAQPSAPKMPAASKNKGGMPLVVWILIAILILAGIFFFMNNNKGKTGSQPASASQSVTSDKDEAPAK